MVLPSHRMPETRPLVRGGFPARVHRTLLTGAPRSPPLSQISYTTHQPAPFRQVIAHFFRYPAKRRNAGLGRPQPRWAANHRIWEDRTAAKLSYGRRALRANGGETPPL